MEIGYLQHGSAENPPMRTESVTVKHEYAGRWLAFYEGKWRRVHIQVKRCYIVYMGKKITIKIEGV